MSFPQITRQRSAANAGWTPAQLFPRWQGGWWTGFDPDFMTVNSNGTGGSPSVGQRANRLIDRSGNGRHLTATSGTNGPYYRGDHAAFAYEIGVTRAGLLTSTGIPGASMSSMTGLCVMSSVGILEASATPMSWDAAITASIFYLRSGSTRSIDYIFGSHQPDFPTVRFPSRNVYVAWRARPGLFEANINGRVFMNRNWTWNRLHGKIALGTSHNGGGPTKLRFRDMVLFGVSLPDDEWASLLAYGARSAGSNSIDTTRSILGIGDSLTAGDGSETARSYMDQLTFWPQAEQLNMGIGGQAAFDVTSLRTTQIIARYPPRVNGSVAIVMYGINDIRNAAATGAGAYASVKAIAVQYKNAGYKTVICTLPDTAGFSSIVSDLNTAMRADWTSCANALADVGAATELSNSANSTYFSSDGVHLKDAGYAVLASIVQAAATPLL